MKTYRVSYCDLQSESAFSPDTSESAAPRVVLLTDHQAEVEQIRKLYAEVFGLGLLMAVENCRDLIDKGLAVEGDFEPHWSQLRELLAKAGS